MNVSARFDQTSPRKSALWMYDDLGLNVFPLPYGRKSGYPWKKLQSTRLNRNDPRFGLSALMSVSCNVAVMVGRTSGNLLVLDYETTSGFVDAIRLCQKRGIPVWAVRTTRGGHLWFRCAEGVVRSVRGGEVELRGHTGYVLAPPSFNEASGVTYTWLMREGSSIPVISIHDLDFLPFPVELEKPPRRTAVPLPSTCPLTPTGRFLNRSTQRYLEWGRSYPVGTRHNAYFHACCDYVEKGFNYYEILRDLMPIARASGLPDDGDTKVLFRVATWAVNRIQVRPAYQPQGQQSFPWKKALAFLNSRPWKGRTGSTDRAVALALIYRARQFSNEKGTFRATYREIGVLAHISNRGTIKKSLDRLKAIPFVCYAGEDPNTEATLWRFSDYVQHTKCAESEPLPLNTYYGAVLTGTPCDSSTGSVTTLPDTMRSDALERGALGMTGWFVYCALLSSSQPTSFADLVERSGLSEGQVRYALRTQGWLRKAGLVERVRGGWTALRATREQLDMHIARPAGKLGSSRRRIERFAKERALNAGREIAFARQAWLRIARVSEQKGLRSVWPTAGPVSTSAAQPE
jgi:bifunctional DNA primase/polymerase-like protein